MSSWVELSMSWWVPDWTWTFSCPIQVGYIVRSPVCNPHSGLHIYVWLGFSLVSNWVELSMSWWVPDWTWAFSCPIQVGYIVHIPVCNPHSGLHIYVWLGSSLVNSWVELSMSWWVPDWTWAFSFPWQEGKIGIVIHGEQLGSLYITCWVPDPTWVSS